MPSMAGNSPSRSLVQPAVRAETGSAETVGRTWTDGDPGDAPVGAEASVLDDEGNETQAPDSDKISVRPTTDSRWLDQIRRAPLTRA